MFDPNVPRDKTTIENFKILFKVNYYQQVKIIRILKKDFIAKISDNLYYLMKRVVGKGK